MNTMKLSADEMRALVQNLPPPISSWSAPGNKTYKVYRIKSAHDPRWINDVLHELLLSMRSSYHVYGDRPPLDEFDAKSAIYAVQAQYPFKGDYKLTKKKRPVTEEWLSIRLVPATGEPKGAAELDFFTCKGKLVADIAQERLCVEGESFLDVLPGCSRMCGVDPYFVDEKEAPVGVVLSPRHSQSAVCYALMSACILEDLKSTKARYITGMIINRFVESTLTIILKGRAYPIAFTPAWKVLGIDGPSSVKLRREGRGPYSTYEYPAYFFGARALTELLATLFQEGKLTPETFHHYLGDEFDVETIRKEQGMALVGKLRHLSRLLIEKDAIVGSAISGPEIRALVDQCVPDAPELKITLLGDLERSIEAMLHAVGIKQTS